MSGRDEQPEREVAHGDDGAVDEVPAAADPVVIDLRDGVDTVAAYEADQARRSSPTRPPA